MLEEWKNIVGYEGLYQVSNYGRIKSLKYHGHDYEKIIKTNYQDKKGYKCVCLTKEGIKKTYKIHRLVAIAFIPNPENLPQINHKDENTANNEVGNLEWCDNKYNCNYGNRGLHISKATKGLRINHKSLSKQVIQLSKTMSVLKIYPSLSEAGRQTGINIQNICFCCKNNNRTAGGFYWRYA